MGYQVGNQCFTSIEAAENQYFSAVAPAVSAGGELIKPEYSGTQWILNGTVIHAQLPPCDPEQNLKDGMELGWLLFGIMAVLYGFKWIKGLMR
ncbi:hypothetical protein [Snodgrassella sp. CFCC 13594]|uniref:hypothetical protein n=1 Tax=Snodgrassella sp. CFCC 13594 TaxID=1775559 RepID=UPI00082AB425|nr:hypothetical protein [Snodgrassella sp. CFCC 13594]